MMAPNEAVPWWVSLGWMQQLNRWAQLTQRVPRAYHQLKVQRSPLGNLLCFTFPLQCLIEKGQNTWLESTQFKVARTILKSEWKDFFSQVAWWACRVLSLVMIRYSRLTSLVTFLLVVIKNFALLIIVYITNCLALLWFNFDRLPLGSWDVFNPFGVEVTSWCSMAEVIWVELGNAKELHFSCRSIWARNFNCKLRSHLWRLKLWI